MISNILKYIIFIIMLAITIYYYINHRNIGCRDKDALNYNSEVNIHDKTKCIFKVKGCMDKDAPNYNLYANTSCKEDCTGCELKGNCKLCESQDECTESCPECICKSKVRGCTRDWAINYDKNATIESECISIDDIMKKISIVSGGDCEQCSGRVSVRVGDQYPILGGKYGINVLVLERHKDLKVRFSKSFSTGNYEIENKKFVDFMKKFVFHRDIVIITVRGDATGRKRTNTFENVGDNSAFIGDKLENYDVYTSLSLAEKACLEGASECIGINKTDQDEYVLMSYKSKLGYKKGFNALKRKVEFLDRILTDDSQKILQLLGAKNPEIIREGSYILIGTFLNDIYYETYSANADSYFPYFMLESFGCMNINHPYFEKKKLNPGKNKLLSNTGDTGEIDLNRVDVIYRCAQEALREGYRLFSVSKTNVYVYKEKEEHKKEINVDEYFKFNSFLNYRNELNRNFRIGTGECKTNFNLLPYGNNFDESVYYIKDISYSGLFTMFYENMMVQTFGANSFNGFRRDLGVGNHRAVSIISLSPRAIDGKLYIPLNSLKVPEGLKVTLFRNVYKDEDLELFNSYDFRDEKQKKSYFELNLNEYDGVKIMSMDEKGRTVRELEYRTWNDIKKSMKIKSKEEVAKVYLYNRPIEKKKSELSIPCTRYGVMVPGWYQDTRFDQRNQCAAPKGKKCCNVTYNQGSKKDQKVRLDGVIILNGNIVFNEDINIFYPLSSNDKSWLEFKFNYPEKGDILVKSNDETFNKLVEYELENDSLKILNQTTNLTNMTLITLGKEACNVDFDNIRSSQEVKDWIEGCKDNLDEITSIEWEDLGKNTGFSGNELEGAPTYYTLEDAQLGCSSFGTDCSGFNRNLDSNYVLMAADSTIGTLRGFNGFKRVDNLITKPEERTGYDLDEIYNVKYFKEIERLKNADYEGKVGYIELYDKNGNKVRQIEFNNWFYFFNNISYDAKEIKFSIKTVKKDAVILQKTLTLEGPSKDEVNDNILFKEYPNIIRDQKFTSDIGFSIINMDKFNVTFYEDETNEGLSFSLGYGRYNLPDSLSFIIQSIKVSIPFCIVRLFMDYNFEEELIRFIHYVEADDIRYTNLNNFIDNNVRVKSIIIDKLPFDNLVSNNSSNNNYDENIEYKELEYPITYKFKNIPVSNLDLTYDIFEDGIKLYDNDKKIFIVNEQVIAGYVSGIDIIKGTFINSGGGYGFVNKVLVDNQRNDIVEYLNNKYGVIESYNNSNSLRKIIFFGGKVLGIKNENGSNKFFSKSLSELGFSKKERYILIKGTDDVSVKNSIDSIFKSNISLDKKLNQIYNLLSSTIFEKQLISINLPQSYEFLIDVPLINENNRSLLNTNFNVQILDDKGNITKYVKFYGQRYVIDYNIDINNKLSKANINISKHEKYAIIKNRTSYIVNSGYQFNYDSKFNYRLDFISTTKNSINSRLQSMTNDFRELEGYIETRNRIDTIINKYSFNKGRFYRINDQKLEKDIIFKPEEAVLKYYDKFNKLKMVLPIKSELTIDSINSVLNYYLYNEKCYIKLFNRYSNLVKLVLCKNGKFLEKDNNGKDIYINNFSEFPKSINRKYSYLFDVGDWSDSQGNMEIDLDQNQVSIQLDNGTEILMIEVDPGDLVLNFNDLDNLLKVKKGINLTPNITGSKYSNIQFKDKRNKIAKELTLTGDIVLFNMPVKYLELNYQDTVYKLLNNKNEIMKIIIPKGMNGVYKYGSDQNQIEVEKVVRINNDEAILYDKGNNIIQTTKDYDLHNYIFGVKFENYKRRYEIVYYPKINQWAIKLLEQTEKVNVIEMYDIKTYVKQNIYDELGNIIKTVNGNKCYIVENNYTNMKLINRDNTYKYYFGFGLF